MDEFTTEGLRFLGAVRADIVAKRNPLDLVGLSGVLFAFASVLCALLVPYSPWIFLLGVLGLQVLSLVLIAIAGFLRSRFWFIAASIPAFFLFCFIFTEYRQQAEISLKGSRVDGIVFKLSGTEGVPSFYVSAYSPEVQEPFDERFVLWRIQSLDPKGFGEPAWKLASIKYGVVPAGYVQTFPEHNTPPSPLVPDKTYRVSVMYPLGRAFEIVNEKPKWVSIPSECFTTEHGKWKRVPCASNRNP